MHHENLVVNFRGGPFSSFACLWMKRSRFKPWLGTLHCVLGQDTTVAVPFPTQVWVPANTETGISSGLMGHMNNMETLPLVMVIEIFLPKLSFCSVDHPFTPKGSPFDE